MKDEELKTRTRTTLTCRGVKSCIRWGRQGEGKWEKGKGKGRGKKGNGGKGWQGGKEGKGKREGKREVKDNRKGRKMGKEIKLKNKEVGEGNQVSCNFIHPCSHLFRFQFNNVVILCSVLDLDRVWWAWARLFSRASAPLILSYLAQHISVSI